VPPARICTRPPPVAVLDRGESRWRPWFLINASPDVRHQLARLAGRGPARDDSVRHVPIEGVLLTDAELDHSLGIVLLREARTLAVYATDATVHILEHDSRILPRRARSPR